MVIEVCVLQVGVWFSYGCASLAGKQYKQAATAFRRCVNLNTDVSTCCTDVSTCEYMCCLLVVFYLICSLIDENVGLMSL